MRHLSIISAALGAIWVAGCQASADDPVPPTSNGGSNAAAQSRAPAEAGTVFVQTFPEAGYPTPDTVTSGRFAVRQGCLVFESGGEAFRAVLPAGSRYAGTEGIIFAGGGRAELGRTLAVKGGEGEFGVASDVPAACPSRALLIGGVK